MRPRTSALPPPRELCRTPRARSTCRHDTRSPARHSWDRTSDLRRVKPVLGVASCRRPSPNGSVMRFQATSSPGVAGSYRGCLTNTSSGRPSAQPPRQSCPQSWSVWTTRPAWCPTLNSTLVHLFRRRAFRGDWRQMDPAPPPALRRRRDAGVGAATPVMRVMSLCHRRLPRTPAPGNALPSHRSNAQAVKQDHVCVAHRFGE